MTSGVDPSIARGVGVIGAGSEAATAAAMMMSYAAMNNPLLSHAMILVEKPKFRGTAEEFPEFKRQWKEYVQTVLSSFPAMSGTQMLTLLRGCLDQASILQLRRELENDPDLTADTFMHTLERDYGRDCALQAREE